MKTFRLDLCALAASASLTLTAVAPAQVPYLSVWTAHNDNNRSGANLNEASLTPSNVNQSSFGRLFTVATDGDMYGQPLYVRAITLGGAIVNAVYVSSANNSVYCFDADSGATYWSKNLAPAIPEGNVQCCCTDIETVIGIISTGVIDLTSNTWYVVTQEYNSGTGAYAQHLHALDLTSGNEKFGGPAAISGSNNGQIWSAKMNNQRSALLLQNGVVYIAWSSHNDCTPYTGWIMGYNASTLAQTFAYADTASNQGGIWMAGGGIIGDGANVYVTTGNGNFNLNTGGSDAGMCFLRLNGSGVRQDYFSPYNESAESGADADLGGGGILWIPGSRDLIGGGKDGNWYLVNMDNMGGYNGSTNSCLQVVYVSETANGTNGGKIHTHGPPTYFNGLIYEGAESSYYKGWAWNGSTLGTSPATESSFTDVINSMPGFQGSASGNGAQNGILWATRCSSGNANQATEPGIMHAFQAGSLGTELYDTLQNSSRDNFGNFAKNPAPVCANGKVYVPTFSNQLAVYGPLTNYRSGCSGLMSSWRLSDGSGTSAADSTGNGNTGAVSGTANWTAGPTGNFGAFTFNGSTHINCGNAQSLNPTEAISVTCWFKSTQAPVSGGAAVIFHDLSFNALQIEGDGTHAQAVVFNEGPASYHAVQFNWTSYNDGNWHHYASTYDMTHGCKIYIDGTLVASDTTLRGPLATAGGDPFMLGSKQDGTVEYNGSLAEVGVWGRALSPAEISGLAAKGASGNVGGAYVEAEQAQVVQNTAGVGLRIIDDAGASNSAASIQDGTAVGNKVAYLVQNLFGNVANTKSYTVKVGYKAYSSRGIVQTAIGAAGSPSPTNWGNPIDEYTATAGGTWSSTTIATNFAPGTAGDKWVWFTVTGKNASSSGYTSCIDYIEFTPN